MVWPEKATVVIMKRESWSYGSDSFNVEISKEAGEQE